MSEWGWAVVGVYGLGVAVTGTLFLLLDDRDLGYDPWPVTAMFCAIFSTFWPVFGAVLAAGAFSDWIVEGRHA